MTILFSLTGGRDRGPEQVTGCVSRHKRESAPCCHPDQFQQAPDGTSEELGPAPWQRRVRAHSLLGEVVPGKDPVAASKERQADGEDHGGYRRFDWQP